MKAKQMRALYQKGGKEMKKKLVSLLLCAALAVGALAGCGSSDPEENQKLQQKANQQPQKEPKVFLHMQSAVIRGIH